MHKHNTKNRVQIGKGWTNVVFKENGGNAPGKVAISKNIAIDDDPPGSNRPLNTTRFIDKVSASLYGKTRPQWIEQHIIAIEFTGRLYEMYQHPI